MVKRRSSLTSLHIDQNVFMGIHTRLNPIPEFCGRHQTSFGFTDSRKTRFRILAEYVLDLS